MFCPVCAGELEAQVNVYGGTEGYCRRGDMVVSEAMWHGLSKCFVDGGTCPPDFAPKPGRVKWGGQWFCPYDGTPTVERHGQVRCPGCARALTRFLPQLVELHVHKKVETA